MLINRSRVASLLITAAKNQSRNEGKLLSLRSLHATSNMQNAVNPFMTKNLASSSNTGVVHTDPDYARNLCPYLWSHQPTLGQNVLFCPTATLIGGVSVGDDSAIWYGCILRADINTITIGKRTNVQDGTIMHVTSVLPTKVGDDVTIGHKAIIHACQIDDRCLIGMGAIIMDDAHIGEDSIVAAGAVVTKRKSFPPRSLIMGNPAKVVRELTPKEIETIRLSADKYVHVKNAFLIRMNELKTEHMNNKN